MWRMTKNLKGINWAIVKKASEEYVLILLSLKACEQKIDAKGAGVND
jgi:hypothetical protein